MLDALGWMLVWLHRPCKAKLFHTTSSALRARYHVLDLPEVVACIVTSTEPTDCLTLVLAFLLNRFGRTLERNLYGREVGGLRSKGIALRTRGVLYEMLNGRLLYRLKLYGNLETKISASA